MNSPQDQPTDLFVLVADQNTLAAIRGLMERRKSLRLDESFTFEIRPHPEHDPGCLLRSHEFLGPFQRQYRFAVVVFDREGCGSDDDRGKLEASVEERLSRNGWKDRSAAIVIDPELENWVWSDSPHVAESLGWTKRNQDVRHWLRSSGDLAEGAAKPGRPKEAMERVLRQTKKPRSSTVYEALARKVGLSSCRDPAFGKLRTILQSWFPA
jgi:hypothetical protein